MKIHSSTLLAIAACALAPMAHASVSVRSDDVSLGLRLQLQVRAEKAWASNGALMYNVPEGRNGEPDDLDFYIRRARLGFSGTWRQNYKFSYILRNDNQDKTGTTVTTSNRVPQTHVAFVERVFKQEDLDLEHGVRMGLDYAWFNGASAVFSSSSFLFPTARATDQGAMLAPRGVGVGYKLSHKMFALGLDVQNNTGDDNSNAGSALQGEGLFYGARVHLIPFDSDEKGHMRPVESFVGKEGTGVLISAEFGVNQNDNTPNTRTVNTKAYGFEVLGHWDGLTGLLEWRQAIRNTDNRTGADARRVSTCYLIQAGYALPFGDQFLEPALRLTKLNLDGGAGEFAPYGSSEYGASGRSFDLGVNYYIHGHNNKLQLAWQHWSAEKPVRVPVAPNKFENKRPDADIVRLQWQLNF
ncbi:MAG: OprO/OprP family phosphate-selective porin [Planctomycetota bacterium]|nr:OprO/OprP family phosphate-selective porin [Planctomycetota bacterium]